MGFKGESVNPGADMTFNGPDVPLFRQAADPFGGSAREYVWTDDANCAGMDPTLFEVALEGDPRVGDMKPRQVMEWNKENLPKVAAICSDCPVKQKCLDEATPGDKYWTIRGGELPGRVILPGRARGYVPSWDMEGYDVPWNCEKHGNLYKRDYERANGLRQVYCDKCRKR